MLQGEDTLHGGHIILEGRLRVLGHADVEVVPNKVVVNAPPARAVRPDTVDENNIFHFGILGF